ncbi:hypothetical protein niasHT_007070 [Heterodera trifolii]|uniref:Uncharacterized protein n=1 Tax=Heterodera trifolii TaxID=157864 RepID=A0ABD2LXH1_9BILA
MGLIAPRPLWAIVRLAPLSPRHIDQPSINLSCKSLLIKGFDRGRTRRFPFDGTFTRTFSALPPPPFPPMPPFPTNFHHQSMPPRGCPPMSEFSLSLPLPFPIHHPSDWAFVYHSHSLTNGCPHQAQIGGGICGSISIGSTS